MRTAPAQRSGSSTTRRTKAEIRALEDALVAIVEEHAPLTIRHAFYLAVSAGLVEKTEAAYKTIVARLLLRLRRQRRVEYRSIADESRFVRRVPTWRSAEAALAEMARFYRRDLLRDQKLHVEVWVEKVALVGVIGDVCDEYAVPVFPTSGFASESFIYEAAREIVAALADKLRVLIFTLGDHDPSGVLITKDLEKRLRRLVAEIAGVPLPFEVERLALLPEQIRRHQLPTRPTKRQGNTHARAFRSQRSVELDALPPEVLREIVRGAIELEIDDRRLARTRRVENAERETLAALPTQLGGSR